jgi:Zn ribbon nucleic-acid-binding protein
MPPLRSAHGQALRWRDSTRPEFFARVLAATRRNRHRSRRCHRSIIRKLHPPRYAPAGAPPFAPCAVHLERALHVNCPLCRADTLVIHTDGNRRRRECVNCKYRWTTVELSERELKRLRRVAKVAADLTDTLREDYVANVPR